MKKNYMCSIDDIQVIVEEKRTIKEIIFINISEKKIKNKCKTALKTYDLTDHKKEGKVTGWIEKSKPTTLYIGSEGITIFPTNSSQLLSAYHPCWNLEEVEKITFGNIDTSKVENMSSIFSGLKMIEELDLSAFDTKNVVSMDGMFEDCIKLKRLNLQSFNTENVTSMDEMFFECFNLEYIDLSSFSTKSVEDFAFMFIGCRSLKVLDLKNFNTEKAKYMGKMFSDCESLLLLDISSFSFDNLDLTRNHNAIYNIFEAMPLMSNVLVQGQKEKNFLIENKIIPRHWNEYNLFINEK